MDISVNSSTNQLEISLGHCRAKLSTSQAQVLRDQLAEVLLSALHKPPNYWQNLAARLNELNHLIATLYGLDEVQRLEVIQASHQPHWLALVRFARKEQPLLADDFLKAITKINPQAFTSLEAFKDQLHLEPASSLAEVIIALETLQPLLEKYSEPPQLQAEIEIKKPSFNARAISFLIQLSDLPTSNLRLILKSLSGKELGLLFSACKMLNVPNFFIQLKGILPEKLFQQLESKCLADIEEAELRNLLSKLNQELKELKQLLNNRKRQQHN